MKAAFLGDSHAGVVMAVAQIFDQFDFVFLDELVGAEDDAFGQILRRDIGDGKAMKLRVEFQLGDQVRYLDDIKTIFPDGVFGTAEVFVVRRLGAVYHDVAEFVKLVQRADGQGNYVQQTKAVVPMFR